MQEHMYLRYAFCVGECGMPRRVATQGHQRTQDPEDLVQLVLLQEEEGGQGAVQNFVFSRTE